MFLHGITPRNQRISGGYKFPCEKRRSIDFAAFSRLFVRDLLEI